MAFSSRIAAFALSFAVLIGAQSMAQEPKPSNDTLNLSPVTEFDGPALEFDFPGLKIGFAEYEEGPTGCTVFHFGRGIQTAADIRGGMVGVIEADYGFHHAICFAGGSLLGFEAALGVVAELVKEKGYVLPDSMPMVAGAIIYDWFGRPNAIYPDKELGRAATASAKEGRFLLGRRGAGRSAGMGQGAAFRQIGATRIAVFSVVNALGQVIDRDGNAITRDRKHPLAKLEERLAANASAETPTPGRQTTLTLVVTNQKWNGGALQQIARQVHSSMSRAIQPFHTMYDGDVLFIASTGEVENETLSVASDFALIASELAWDAVIRAVPTGK